MPLVTEIHFVISGLCHESTIAAGLRKQA